LEVSGKIIKAALEHGLSKVGQSSGRFLQVSGMTVSYDKNKPAGARIVEVLVNGLALDMAKKYKLAANSYIAGGGNGYKMLRKSKVLIGDFAAKLQANNVMVYIRKQGSISPKIEGRIKLVRANN
jgi:2',3'-cyclic-nucleotide 2'-phosphodiesterase (5'-nucleotidase family)